MKSSRTSEIQSSPATVSPVQAVLSDKSSAEIKTESICKTPGNGGDQMRARLKTDSNKFSKSGEDCEEDTSATFIGQAHEVVVSTDTTKFNDLAQDHGLECAGLFVQCLQWKYHESVVKKADDTGADMVCTKHPNGIPKVFGRGPSGHQFKTLICHNLHDYANRQSCTASTYLMFSATNNWMRWPRALTGHGIPVRSHPEEIVACLMAGALRPYQSSLSKSVSPICLPGFRGAML